MPLKDREARLAYLRAWKARNRPPLKPVPQTDPALPPRGAMSFSADGLRVQCHVCGVWLKALNVHLRTHGLDARSYKEMYDLPRTISMLPRATREKQSDAALARDLGSIGRAHIPPAVGRPTGQVARLGARIEASDQRKGINTRAGNKTRAHPPAKPDPAKL